MDTEKTPCSIRTCCLLQWLLGFMFWLIVPASIAGSEPFFSDATHGSGLDFIHFNGMSGEFYLPEIMGPGVALLDYDGDGDLDVFLIQGTMLGPGKTLEDARFPPTAGMLLGNRLFRNDLTVTSDGESVLRFTDVSEGAGIQGAGYGMGVATGDYDNDGWVDIYVTNFGRNRLLRNRAGGGFEDVTERAAVGDASWSVSAAFLDYDRDGWLDLFVGNYVGQALKNHKPCRAPSSALDYCTPMVHKDQPDRLYRNRKGQGFVDASKQGGGYFKRADIGRGVALGDLDNDGDTDILVANNAGAARLLLNSVSSRARWIGLDVRARNGAPATGARVELRFADGSNRWFSVRTDGSYASAKDPRVLVGLRRGKGPKEVRVHWPDGKQETWTDLPRTRYSTLRRGGGKTAE